MVVNKFLDKIKYGQFFLEDKRILQEIVNRALIKKDEVILEIGAGDGRLTQLLAQKAFKVIAIEIDPQFAPTLKKMPRNVQIIIGDVLTFLSTRPSKKFSKIVANLPSVLVEPLFQKLPRTNLESGVFLVPEKFAYKLANNQPFKLYFEVELIQKVAKSAFLPVPRTNWEIVFVKKIGDPLKSGDISLFLKQYLYEHPKAQLRNSLREAIIKISEAQNRKLTKNQARKIIASFKLGEKTLSSLSGNFSGREDLLEDLSKLLQER